MNWLHHCVRHNEPLSRHTSFRIGGPAEYFAQPQTLEELISVLSKAQDEHLLITLLGGGTNTLASDAGVKGLVLHPGKGFAVVRIVDSPKKDIVEVHCGAALSTQRLVSLAQQRGWGDLECLAGMPGQIGGAVAMNAQDIGRFVQKLRLVKFDGTIHTLNRSQLKFEYRNTAFPPGLIIDVQFIFKKIPKEEASTKIRKTLSRRNETQDISMPSAGCAFRNPKGKGAGALIDKAGLKGLRIGDAQVSSKHANFIVNLGHATCKDVLFLMEKIQKRIMSQFSVMLQPEVRVLGESPSSNLIVDNQ